jgi:hypothetical protein
MGRSLSDGVPSFLAQGREAAKGGCFSFPISYRLPGRSALAKALEKDSFSAFLGEMAERSKASHSKCDVGKPTVGSNPTFSSKAPKGLIRRGDREAEGARLEIVCGATHRGFESLPLRHEAARRSSCKLRQARKGATVVSKIGCAASFFSAAA